jgi:hypothetical protein
VSPDQILDYAPRGSRVVQMDANVVAYFGDLFQAFRSSLQDLSAPASAGAAKPKTQKAKRKG